jgi:diguanylate cyclase (GGDEF)-like protein
VALGRAAVLKRGQILDAIGLAGVMTLVFLWDRLTGVPHVQHLYYLPIVFAGIRFGMAGGVGASVVAIALYHLANSLTVSLRYDELDLLQMAVFLGVGVVAARLAAHARRLRQLATTDDLTGLHNLRSFEAGLKDMVEAARGAGTPVALLVLDLDRLKSLNDAHGHLAGAEAVRTIGRIIAAHVPPDGIACRYGGDEFVIALPGCSASKARHFAERLRRTVLSTAPILDGADFPPETLSISIGIACGAFDRAAGKDDESEALFRAADAALYVAKNNGRNQVVSSQ